MKKENIYMLKRIDLLILGIIIILACALRLYKIDTPVADFHSWRQADTAAVARNFVRDGIDMMHPKYDDLSNVQSGKENPEGHRFVEFPIYNALIAIGSLALPFLSLDIVARSISIISSLIVLAIIYYFLVKEDSRTSAIIGSLVFAVFPFFVFFSRVILPEMNGLAFSFLALLFCYKYSQDKVTRSAALTFLILSSLSFAAALLIKPTTIFFGIPLLYLFFKKSSFGLFKNPFMYIFFILSAIPLILWRQYILQYPEGIPVSSWLITGVNTGTGLQVIFFRPAFFRWVFYERINNLILGGYATTLFVLGLLVKLPFFFLHSIIIAAVVYLFVFQGGNVQHVYYQTFILPALAISVGMGAAFLIRNATLFLSKVGVYAVIAITLIFSAFISYYQVKDYYAYPEDLVTISKYVKLLTSPEDKIVTDTTGDTTLLYLSDRKGAPAVYKSLPDLKNIGYTYFVTLNKDVAKAVKKETTFQVVEETDKFTLFKL